MFGFAVAAGHDTIVVGAPNHRGNGDRAGAVYVFERRGDGWSRSGQAHRQRCGAATWFGNAVAISRDTIVVGMLTNGEVSVQALRMSLSASKDDGWK